MWTCTGGEGGPAGVCLSYPVLTRGRSDSEGDVLIDSRKGSVLCLQESRGGTDSVGSRWRKQRKQS